MIDHPARRADAALRWSPRRLSILLAALAALVAAPVAAQPLKGLEADVTAGRATVEETLLLAKNWIIAKRLTRALRLLDRTTAVNPVQDAARQILRGLALEGLVSNGAAVAAYEAALAAVPEDPAALLRLGVLSYRLGDLDRARDLLRRSVARGPGNPEAWLYLYITARLPDERAMALRLLLANDGPDGPWARRALAAKK